MEKTSLSANMTVFIVFFGASLLDAFVTRSWWRAAFWLAIALVFFAADYLGRRRERLSRTR
jgi:hypothetical protein